MPDETLTNGAVPGEAAPVATEPVATPNPTNSDANPSGTSGSPVTGTTPDPLGEAALATPTPKETPDPLVEAATKKEEPVSKAPEKYEAFKVGEQELSSEAMASFEAVARKNGLSQEQAQEYVNSMVPALQAQQQSYQKQWLEQCANDAEIGGARMQENMAIAGAGYRQYASEDLQAVLKATGLSRHPAVVRHFYRLGKAIQQDTGVVGGASAPAPKMSLYPNSQMVRDLE